MLLPSLARSLLVPLNENARWVPVALVVAEDTTRPSASETYVLVALVVPAIVPVTVCCCPYAS
ncbi:hypothetical protein [Fodinicola feengrottensis]|uniref:hypothetical protein n=1 Tax=Fodinicola feengrottensis TaxID=435914 RepID=UPI00244321A1|nr:hypothetical protein [Fodinicola feengrottensis]